MYVSKLPKYVKTLGLDSFLVILVFFDDFMLLPKKGKNTVFLSLQFVQATV